MQNQLFYKIRQFIPVENSLIEVIAEILDINYDAAYRRVNNKSKLSLSEGVLLAKHFKISLNKLYEVGSKTTILADVSPNIDGIKGLENYFKTSLNNIQQLLKLKKASIVYSAKDIPIFYTLKDSHLTKYKCYVWLKFLDEDGSMQKMSFLNFIEHAPQSLFKAAQQLAETYEYINIVEFWNDNTINGTLQQILYYFETGKLDLMTAKLICKDLKAVVDHVEQQCIKQLIIGSKNDATYQLYKSDLLTMSNTIMIQAGKPKVFFTPFTVLTYLKVEHEDTCKRLERFFEKQRRNSKLLVNAGEKDRSHFFYKMHQKIDLLIERMELYRTDPFF